MGLVLCGRATSRFALLNLSTPQCRLHPVPLFYLVDTAQRRESITRILYYDDPRRSRCSHALPQQIKTSSSSTAAHERGGGGLFIFVMCYCVWFLRNQNSVMVVCQKGVATKWQAYATLTRREGRGGGQSSGYALCESPIRRISENSSSFGAEFYNFIEDPRVIHPRKTLLLLYFDSSFEPPFTTTSCTTHALERNHGNFP